MNGGRRKAIFSEKENWTFDLMNRLSGRRPRQRMKFARRFIRTGDNRNIPASNLPWVRRWCDLTSHIELSNVSYPFMVNSKGVLCFRTLTKNGSVRRAPIPFLPGLLAGLISWGCSPHASKQGEWLVAAQMNWTAPYENAETADKPFRRSMQFLRGVLEQFPNDTWVHRSPSSCVGCSDISTKSESTGEPTMPHSKFTALKKMTQRHSICIHTGKHHRDIPIGDTIAIVILSLLSDVTTAERVSSLHMHLMTQPPVGTPQKGTGIDPQTFYQSRGEKYRFPLHQAFMPDFAKQEPLALDSLELISDDALFEDWKMRPYHDGSIDAPGHLNQGLNLISAMKTIRFWKAISSINDVVVQFFRKSDRIFSRLKPSVPRRRGSR